MKTTIPSRAQSLDFLFDLSIVSCARIVQYDPPPTRLLHYTLDILILPAVGVMGRKLLVLFSTLSCNEDIRNLFSAVLLLLCQLPGSSQLSPSLFGHRCGVDTSMHSPQSRTTL